MLKSYEAIHQKGHLHWVDERPPIESARVIVTILTDQQAFAKRRHPPPFTWLARWKFWVTWSPRSWMKGIGNA